MLYRSANEIPQSMLNHLASMPDVSILSMRRGPLLLVEAPDSFPASMANIPGWVVSEQRTYSLC